MVEMTRLIENFWESVDKFLELPLSDSKDEADNQRGATIERANVGLCSGWGRNPTLRILPMPSNNVTDSIC